jgi:cysteine-rich repeat protein
MSKQLRLSLSLSAIAGLALLGIVFLLLPDEWKPSSLRGALTSVTEEIPPDGICGDGVLDYFDNNEECDDGNTVNGDGCDEHCTLECGNGIVDGEEECDDGNQQSEDGCSAGCVIEFCGDGIVQVIMPGIGEQCDDGNAIDGDGCSAGCLWENECGNGIVEPPEECDGDGGDIFLNCTDGGNGIVEPPEECDGDGGDIFLNCTDECKIQACGDGRLDPPEECDDGKKCATPNQIGDSCTSTDECGLDVNGNQMACQVVSGDGCSVACEKEYCGDGKVNLEGEECDDGNADDFDGCTNACHFRRPGCGNEQLDEGEDCDDGLQCFAGGPSCTEKSEDCPNCDTHDFDGCSSSCKNENTTCGDGTREGIEECDDGNTENNDLCSSSCKVERCGDGIVQKPREECDDGAQCADGTACSVSVEFCPSGSYCRPRSGDGCDQDCKYEHVCGDGIVVPPEQCDDGNTSNNDGCSSTCMVERCGDGIVQKPREECDDGNNRNGDGCSGSCHWETPGSPSVKTPQL